MVLRGNTYSNVLESETGITVITPVDCGQVDNNKKYRICYVLHGLGGGNGDFANYTMLPYFAYDKDIIFICPEVGRNFYTNTEFGTNYFRYITEELPKAVKLVFNISSERKDTAIMGCSMGGYGAIKAALTYPEKYAYCAAFAPSSCFIARDAERYRMDGKEPFFHDYFSVFGKDFSVPPDDDISLLAKKHASDEIFPKIYITVGNKDIFLKDTLEYVDLLKELGFDPDFEMTDGEHDLYFFNDAVKRAVEKWMK